MLEKERMLNKIATTGKVEVFSGYKLGTVFDVSQTEGKPLPELSSDLTGSVEHYDAFMEAIKIDPDRPEAYKFRLMLEV